MNRAIRKCVPYVVCVALCLACSWLFSYATAHEGLVSPSGNPHVGVLLLGVAALGSKVIVLLLLPFIAVYQLLGRIRSFRLQSEVAPER